MKIRAHIFWHRADADRYISTNYIYHCGVSIIGLNPRAYLGMEKMTHITEMALQIPCPPMQLTIRIDLFWKGKALEEGYKAKAKLDMKICEEFRYVDGENI